MNTLDKIEKVYAGLRAMEHMCSSCADCPYQTAKTACSSVLASDAIEMMDGLRDRSKRKADETVEAKPGFIVLTTGVLYSNDGRQAMLTDNGKFAIRVNDILAVSDLVECRGSEVRLKDVHQTIFYVCETLEEILGKIAEGGN